MVGEIEGQLTFPPLRTKKKVELLGMDRTPTFDDSTSSKALSFMQGFWHIRV